MKITKVKLGLLDIPLHKPFKTALRTVEEVSEVIVCMETDKGLVGFGEAPPTAKITGDTQESIIAAIENHLAPAIVGRDCTELNLLLDGVQNAIAGNSSAKAAVDIALHDLWGKAIGLSVHKLFGGGKEEIMTDMTISVDEPKIMAEDAKKAVAQGYRTLKVKVGMDGELDITRLCSIRKSVGQDVQIRIDANQGWTPGEAVRTLKQMEAEGLAIEFCEQPTKADDIAALRYVRERVTTPIMADESVHSARDALAVMQQGAADLINIKLMKAGGLREARHICDLAELFGVECMIGCMLEGKASAAAAAHLAASHPIITKIDLDGPLLFAQDPMDGGASFIGPEITLDGEPGFGIKTIKGVRWL